MNCMRAWASVIRTPIQSCIYLVMCCVQMRSNNINTQRKKLRTLQPQTWLTLLGDSDLDHREKWCGTHASKSAQKWLNKHKVCFQWLTSMLTSMLNCWLKKPNSFVTGILKSVILMHHKKNLRGLLKVCMSENNSQIITESFLENSISQMSKMAHVYQFWGFASRSMNFGAFFPKIVRRENANSLI